MTSAIYDITGTQFVKIKRGQEEMPEAMKPKTLEDLAEEDRIRKECMEKAKAK
jgi:pyruvate carboxylase subunit B